MGGKLKRIFSTIEDFFEDVQDFCNDEESKRIDVTLKDLADSIAFEIDSRRPQVFEDPSFELFNNFFYRECESCFAKHICYELDCGHFMCEKAIIKVLGQAITKNEHQNCFGCKGKNEGKKRFTEKSKWFYTINNERIEEKFEEFFLPIHYTICGVCECFIKENQDSMDPLKMKCEACKSIICLICKGKFVPDEDENCSNPLCSAKHGTLGMLDIFPDISFRFNKNDETIMIPRVRLCVHCGTPTIRVLDDGEGCKHLECKKCGGDFCGICLAAKQKGKKWPCGDTGWDKCELAERQTNDKPTCPCFPECQRRKTFKH